jgi:hypothetical protein
VLARSFSWRYGFNGFASFGSASRLRLDEIRIYLDLAHTLAPGTTIARVRLAFPVTPSLAYY